MRPACPDVDGPWPVTNGGCSWIWWPSSTEIGYVDAEGRTFLVSLLSHGEDLEFGRPRLKAGLGDLLRRAWGDWDPVSRRFLVADPIEDPPPGRVEILQNWMAGLRQ